MTNPKTTAPVRIVTFENLTNGSLKRMPSPAHIAGLIRKEPGMLQINEHNLEQSFGMGLAVFGVIEQRGDPVVVSCLSLAPLLDRKLKVHLGLADSVPDILELRSLYVLERYRGMGLAEEMNRYLLGSRKEELRSGEIMVLALTKEIRAIKTSKRFAEGEGIPFTITEIGNYPMVEAFTCDCRSRPQYLSSRINSGLGTGVSGETFEKLNSKLGDNHSENVMETDIPHHVVYIFYEEKLGGIATKTERLLQEQLTPDKLVEALVEVNYNGMAPGGYTAMMRTDSDSPQLFGGECAVELQPLFNE
jgi:GNAT superfamily N-acetyltransferase